MKTAKLIKDRLDGFTGHAALYELEPPITDGEKTHKRVIVSAVNAMFSGPETYIFPAYEDKEEISDWSELEGSYRGGKDHVQALQNAGYEVS